MKYKKQIHPQLRHIVKIVPYNKLIIKCANIFQTVSFHLTGIPRGVANRRITIAGYKKNFVFEERI